MRRVKKDPRVAALLDVQLSGAILSVVADRVASGKTGVRLKDVLKEAEIRCQQAAWRRRIAEMM